MNVPEQLKKRIQKAVEGYVATAHKHFGKTYVMPRIAYDLRGTTGGEAHGAELVRFNPVLLMENVEDYIANTVPHEVAHCIDSANGDNARPAMGDAGAILNAILSGRRPPRRAKRSIHGPSWQRIMRLFGVEDITRCHQYDVSNARVKTKGKFEYRCVGCDHRLFVTSVIHNKIQRGQFRWHKPCGRVNGGIVYVQNLGKRTYEEARELSKKIEAQKIRLRYTQPGTLVEQLPTHLQNMVQEMRDEAGVVLPDYGAVVPVDFNKPNQDSHDAFVKSLYARVGESQMDRARAYYRAHKGLPRKEMVDRFIRHLGMKSFTASTYYNTLKDE